MKKQHFWAFICGSLAVVFFFWTLIDLGEDLSRFLSWWTIVRAAGFVVCLLLACRFDEKLSGRCRRNWYVTDPADRRQEIILLEDEIVPVPWPTKERDTFILANNGGLIV